MTDARPHQVAKAHQSTAQSPVHVFVLPASRDGRPQGDLTVPAWLIDSNPDELVLESDAADVMHFERSLVIGMATSNGGARFAGAVIDDRESWPESRQRIYAHTGGRVQALLERGQIVPKLCTETLEFVYDESVDFLHVLHDVGIVRKEVLDTVNLCPGCHALPTFRNGCPKCGGFNVVTAELFHHFACGYVGAEDEFDRSHELICPKCRSRQLVIGVDYERLQGSCRCPRCPWSGTEAEPIGHCLVCDLRFPAAASHVEELVGFHANRLDLLALDTVH